LKLLKKIRRLFFFGLKSCVLVSWKLKLDSLLSKLLGSIVIFYNKKEIIQNNKKITILAMERTIFDEDIKALKEYPSNYNILVYPALLRALLFEEVKGIWPEKQIKQQGYFYKNKDKYQGFYRRISNLFYDNKLSFIFMN